MTSVQQENGGAADQEMRDATTGADVDASDMPFEPQRIRVVRIYV